MCHFTPTNRRIQRKPREAQEARRLLQDRLEKAEGLLRQAGIPIQAALAPSPSPTAIQSRSSETEPAPSEPRSLPLNYMQLDPLSSKASIVSDRLSDTVCMPSHSQSQSSPRSLFHHLVQPAGSSTTMEPEVRGATSSPRGDFEHSAMAGSYAYTTQPPMAPPNAAQSRSNILSSGFKKPASSTEVLQLHSPAFTVTRTETPVRDLCLK